MPLNRFAGWEWAAFQSMLDSINCLKFAFSARRASVKYFCFFRFRTKPFSQTSTSSLRTLSRLIFLSFLQVLTYMNTEFSRCIFLFEWNFARTSTYVDNKYSIISLRFSISAFDRPHSASRIRRTVSGSQ
ncbi:hypothetical protein D3C71_1779620 [compost metagenome]